MDKKESNQLMKLATFSIAVFIIIILGGITLSMQFIDTYITTSSSASSWHNIAALALLFIISAVNWTAYERHQRNYQAYKTTKKIDGSHWNDLDATRAQLAIHTAHLAATILFTLFTIIMLIIASSAGRPPYEVYLIGASLILAEAASIMVFIKLQ